MTVIGTSSAADDVSVRDAGGQREERLVDVVAAFPPDALPFHIPWYQAIVVPLPT